MLSSAPADVQGGQKLLESHGGKVFHHHRKIPSSADLRLVDGHQGTIDAALEIAAAQIVPPRGRARTGHKERLSDWSPV